MAWDAKEKMGSSYSLKNDYKLIKQDTSAALWWI